MEAKLAIDRQFFLLLPRIYQRNYFHIFVQLESQISGFNQIINFVYFCTVRKNRGGAVGGDKRFFVLAGEAYFPCSSILREKESSSSCFFLCRVYGEYTYNIFRASRLTWKHSHCFILNVTFHSMADFLRLFFLQV